MPALSFLRDASFFAALCLVVDGASFRSTPSEASKPKILAANTTLAGSHALAVASSRITGKQPCHCTPHDPSWTQCLRLVPKCIFIDLGAADGNTLREFQKDGYGPVANCPSHGDYQAYLVEANPRFSHDLDEAVAHSKGKVHAFASSAAYMCEAKTSFYLDTKNTQHNFWGSSMSKSHPDAQKSGLSKVTVPTVNLMRLLYEETIPEDYVIVKMDIEGAEWDVVPCLAGSSEASLIDRLFLEEHPKEWQTGHTTQAMMDDAKAELKSKGVDIPEYFSQTL